MEPGRLAPTGKLYWLQPDSGWLIFPGQGVPGTAPASFRLREPAALRCGGCRLILFRFG